MGSQAAGSAGYGSSRGKQLGELLAPSERERLLAAMAANCARVGYGAVDVAGVAHEAGLTPSDFDRHFASKEACALAAVNQILAEVTAAVTSVYSPHCEGSELILRAAKALLELLGARPSLAQMACVESRHGMPEAVHEFYETGVRVLVALLERVRTEASDGATALPPPSAGRGALGGAEALVRRELRAGRGERLPELLPEITYGLLVPYLDQREALRYARLAREMLNDGR